MAFRGYIDSISRERILGWAHDTETPDKAVSLVVTANGEVIGRCLANRLRKDLAKAAIGSGLHGFDFRPEIALSPLITYDISVRREGDGSHLKGSPKRLEPSTSFDKVTKENIAQLLAVVDSDEDFDARLSFLNDQSARLRQIRADRQSGRDERGKRRSSRDCGSRAFVRQHDAGRKPRALVIDDRLPLRGHDAGSDAVLSHMRSLQRLGYEVTFAPANLLGNGADLEATGITCCLQPWYASIEEVLQRQNGAFALVYLHRGSNASRYMLLARHHQPKARLIYSVADLHFLRLARQAKVEERPELRAFSQYTRMVETTAAWQADVVITHSNVEADLLRKDMPSKKIHVVPWVIEPNPVVVPFAQRRDLAFIGSYGHPPNVDAAHWLVDKIMPEVWERDSSVRCLLIGSDMPESLRKLQSERVEAMGHVPDLTEIFGRIRLTVAPLAYGAGIKGKVLDSMAAGIPCACTPAAVEGLGLPDRLSRYAAAKPVDLAKAIVALHTDEALNRIHSEAGLAFVRNFANPSRVDALLGKAIGAVPVDVTSARTITSIGVSTAP